MSESDRLTIRDIARECGVKTHNAKYAVETYGIEATWRVGIIRQWARADLPRIKSALARIAGRSGVTAHA